MQTLDQVLNFIEENKKNMDFLPTGFATLDRNLDGGFLRKELVVLGANTGAGKSFMAGQIMFNMAQKGFKTSYFSLEISNAMIVSRLIGQEADIKSIKILIDRLTDGEKKRKSTAQGKIRTYSKNMFFYDDVYEYAEISKHIRENKRDFVVVDFIQNIFVPKMQEYERLSYVALQLQKLAKQTNCCILLLSQFSNQAAKEGNKNPVLEFKGSGSIATVADLGFTLVFDPTLETLDLTLRKNRRGVSGISHQLLFSREGHKLYAQT